MAIYVEGLVKRYGDQTALKGIDLEVTTGEIVAFLGPNGAGKTTAIEILEGFRNRDGGEVLVLGHDPARAPLPWRERIGIVLQESEPIPELTAREAVAQQAGYYSNPGDVDATLDIVGLSDSAGQRTRKLSGGQKRRLDLAQALIGNPELVFLDEPTTGFDPSARRESWDMIEALRRLGKTVLLTTHYMDEAENLADRVAILVAGKVVAQGPPDTLAGRETGKAEITFRLPQGMSGADLPTELSGFTVDSGEVVVSTDQPTALMYALSAWALERGTELHGLTITRPSLEAVYLKLAGSQQSEDGQI
ncbi:MAG: ABC transporter ATP-binding protein [Acidimicrobiia bacterium]|nr:ABC transporter ATP-binding protein [Acidimicrobiia bacterium]